MNARESLAADRYAEAQHEELVDELDELEEPPLIVLALAAIAAELRAARIYANYLEGREGSRASAKRDPVPITFRRES